MLRRGESKALLVAAALVAAACSDDTPTGESCRAAELVSSEVRPIGGNALGATVTMRLQSADSVAVRYGLSADALDSLAPAIVVRSEWAVVPVLGLLPERDYIMRAIAYGNCATTESPELQLRTGSLPTDLPTYHVTGTGASPGFVVFNSGGYGVVMDNTGRVVWYHRLPAGGGLNFQAQPNGHFVARPPATADSPGTLIEIDPLGAVVRSVGCANGFSPRFHDMLMTADGSYWTMCDETRTMDLSGVGGRADARVTGTVIQHLSTTGMLLFQWSPFDHFAITDIAASERTRPDVNWTHGNALDFDQDGNIIVSFRNLNEITKIDGRSGAVIWRMGGLANQFTWEGTTSPAFVGQHGVRVTGPGELLVLDNLGHSDGSRAERYRYDEATRTVRLVQSYVAGEGVVAQVGGTTQSLPGGHVLVTFGNGGRLMEYDAEGRVVWRIAGDAGYVFRAQRIRSLYHPGVGVSR
jgi:outer membrane protein assembly factor BamB